MAVEALSCARKNTLPAPSDSRPNTQYDSSELGLWVAFWDLIWRKLVNEDGRMIPFVAGVGNHECMHSVNMERFFFTDMFAFPDEGPHEFYGVIDFGDYLSLVALDSEMESRAD